MLEAREFLAAAMERLCERWEAGGDDVPAAYRNCVKLLRDNKFLEVEVIELVCELTGLQCLVLEAQWIRGVDGEARLQPYLQARYVGKEDLTNHNIIVVKRGDH